MSTTTFTLRATRRSDATAVTHLINTHNEHLLGETLMTEAELRGEWNAPQFDVETMSRVAVDRPSGTVVGYVEHHKDTVPSRNYFWGRVHPAFTGRGIGSALLHWCEAQAKRCIAEVPLDLPVTMLVSCFAQETAAARLFKAHEMTLARQFYTMAIDFEPAMQPPLWPEAFTLTTLAEYRDLAALWRANDEAFRDHWGHTETSEADGVQQWAHDNASDPHFDPALWLIALANDEIAGYCICASQTTEDADKGHIRRLGVRRPYRQNGLGMLLLRQAFYEMQQRGAKRADLGVDADSLTGATRLYERAGMRIARRSDAYEKVLRPAA